jgi:hypothetical protein
MGGTRASEMSAGIAILGLLIDQPDDVRGLERRLTEVFPLARFSPTSANSAVTRLKGQGHVCEEEVEQVVALPGGGRARYARVRRALSSGSARSGVEAAYVLPVADEEGSLGTAVCRATSSGVAVFELWMGTSSPAPAVREDLRAKLVFAQPEHVPRLIEIIRDEIRMCRREYETVHASLRAIEDHQAEVKEPIDTQEWSTLMMIGVVRDDSAFWTTRINRLERLCQYLEELRDEAARRSLPAHLRRA